MEEAERDCTAHKRAAEQAEEDVHHLRLRAEELQTKLDQVQEEKENDMLRQFMFFFFPLSFPRNSKRKTCCCSREKQRVSSQLQVVQDEVDLAHANAEKQKQIRDDTLVWLISHFSLARSLALVLKHVTEKAPCHSHGLQEKDRSSTC